MQGGGGSEELIKITDEKALKKLLQNLDLKFKEKDDMQKKYKTEKQARMEALLHACERESESNKKKHVDFQQPEKLDDVESIKQKPNIGVGGGYVGQMFEWFDVSKLVYTTQFYRVKRYNLSTRPKKEKLNFYTEQSDYVALQRHVFGHVFTQPHTQQIESFEKTHYHVKQVRMSKSKPKGSHVRSTKVDGETIWLKATDNNHYCCYDHYYWPIDDSENKNDDQELVMIKKFHRAVYQKIKEQQKNKNNNPKPNSKKNSKNKKNSKAKKFLTHGVLMAAKHGTRHLVKEGTKLATKEAIKLVADPLAIIPDLAQGVLEGTGNHTAGKVVGALGNIGAGAALGATGGPVGSLIGAVGGAVVWGVGELIGSWI